VGPNGDFGDTSAAKAVCRTGRTSLCRGDRNPRSPDCWLRGPFVVGVLRCRATDEDSAPSFDRERQVRKHIGDYTLFYAGMFPESINHYRLRRQRVEGFVDWVKAGKESYYIVSKFEHFEYAKVAPLFAQLSQRFEQCVYGLNLVKNELEVMQHPIARRANELIM